MIVVISLNFFFLPLLSSAIIFAPQNKVQGAEASKISKLNNSFGMSSLLKKSLMSSQKAYWVFEMLKISDLTYDWKLSDIDKVQKNNLKVFSFFAGAGGSSMGYKLAG
jgi:hypothetical protein